MNITTELYADAQKRLPATGQVILAHQTDNLMVVYQAYNNRIADFAVANQMLGGADFSYNRMSWIKPNFLWMMYRCGWAAKENQKRVLAIWIDKTDFEGILNNAAISSYNPKYHNSQQEWKYDLNTKEVRLQWDPDHDPYGNKLQRRAVQLGLKGKALEDFGRNQIKRVEDITDFVKQQKQGLDSDNLHRLLVPLETVFTPSDKLLSVRIGIE